MRLAKLDESIINKKLAITIKSGDGKKLINGGTILTDKIIERLKSSGFKAVYIEDDNFDIELEESLDDDKRVYITSKIQDIYKRIENNDFNSVELLRFIRLDLLPDIKNKPVSIPFNEIMIIDDIIQHSINVALLAVRTAIQLGLNMEKIELAAFVAFMHDIGRLFKKKDVNLKNVPHNEISYEFMKRKNCSVLSYMSVKYQNESFNGNGIYKIENQKQIDIAKILGICDFYETLLRTTNLLPYECFEKTQSLVNIKFDPMVFEAFRDSIYIYPVGLPVLLNNKEIGVIVKQNQSYPLRPVIKSNEKYYNLMETLALFIEKTAI